MNLLNLHKNVYDLAADEYEERVESLRPVTQKVVEVLKPYLPEKGKILDIGCGTGLAIEILSANKLQASGIEISPKMIYYAQRRNPNAEIIEGNFSTYHFDKKYNGLLALAFIHLFPKAEAMKVLEKMKTLLEPNGVLYIGTTKSEISLEGFLKKGDYQGEYKRFRKQWTKEEFEKALFEIGFTILKYTEFKDPYNKTWMDFVVRK